MKRPALIGPWRSIHFFFFVLIFIFSSCKKETVIAPVNNDDYSIIRFALTDKLPETDLNSLDYFLVKRSDLKNGHTVYTIPYRGNARHFITLIIAGNNKEIKETKWSIDKNNFIYHTKDLNLAYEETFSRPIQEIVNQKRVSFSSGNSLDPDLEEVVIFAYYTTGSNWLTFIIYNQLTQSLAPTGGSSLGYSSIYQSIEPAGDGGGGGTIFLGPVLEFENELEAAEFFEWQQNANPQELALIAQYPIEALAIFRNSKTAVAKAQEWAAAQGNPQSLSDGKADALRHAYWNALNVSDVGLTIATLFANAHEYGATKPASVPQALWDLQRAMDLHNNQIGRNIAGTQGWGFFTSASTIWDYFYYGAPYGDLNDLKYICSVNGQLIFWNSSCP